MSTVIEVWAFGKRHILVRLNALFSEYRMVSSDSAAIPSQIAPASDVALPTVPKVVSIDHELFPPCSPNSDLINKSTSPEVAADLHEFLRTSLSDVSHRIPGFKRASQPLVVAHTETIAVVLEKLHDRCSRSAVVAKYSRRWGFTCGSALPKIPQSAEVFLKQKPCWSVIVHYSFFDVRVSLRDIINRISTWTIYDAEIDHNIQWAYLS